MTVPDVRWHFWRYSSSNVGISTCVQVYAASFYCDKILLFQLERHATSCTNVHVLYWLLFVSLWTKLTYWDRLPLFIFKMLPLLCTKFAIFLKTFSSFLSTKRTKRVNKLLIDLLVLLFSVNTPIFDGCVFGSQWTLKIISKNIQCKFPIIVQKHCFGCNCLDFT